MPFAEYGEMCSRLLGVPVGQVLINDSGEISVLSPTGEDAELSADQNASRELLQGRLSVELASNRQLEESVSLCQKLKRSLVSKQSFFDNFSHQLRSPLNAVLNLTQVLAEMKLPQEAEDVVSTVLLSTQEVSRLIEDALSLRALDEGQMRIHSSVLQTSEFLSDLSESLLLESLKCNIELKIQGDANLPPEITIDAEKLHQIAVAIFYLVFREPCEEKAKVVASFSWENEGLSFSISAPHFQPNEEDRSVLRRTWMELIRGETLNPGLSMTVTNSLIQMMNGTLDIVDAQNAGCTFQVWLPASPTNEQTSPNIEGQKGIRILAVDDDPTSLLVLKHVVGKLGFLMTTVESGTAALKELGTKEYDLLLLDLRMPGLDGYQVATLVQQDLKLSIPIVAMSADTNLSARTKAEEYGMVDFLPKPIKRERLNQILRSVLPV